MINYAHRMCVRVRALRRAHATVMFVKSLCVSAENPSKSLNEQSNQKTHASKCRPQLLWCAVKRWKLRLLLMSSTTCIVCFSILMATLFEPHNFRTSTYTVARSLARSHTHRNLQWLLQMFFEAINLNLQHLIDK